MLLISHLTNKELAIAHALRRALAASEHHNLYHRHIVATAHAIVAISLALFHIAIDPCKGLWRFSLQVIDLHPGQGTLALIEELLATTENVAFVAAGITCTPIAFCHPPTWQLLCCHTAIGRTIEILDLSKEIERCKRRLHGLHQQIRARPARSSNQQQVQLPAVSNSDLLAALAASGGQQSIPLTDYRYANSSGEIDRVTLFKQIDREIHDRAHLECTLIDNGKLSSPPDARSIFARLVVALHGMREKETHALQIMRHFQRPIFAPIAAEIVRVCTSVGCSAITCHDLETPLANKPITALNIEIARQQILITARHYYSIQWRHFRAIIQANISIDRHKMEHRWEIVSTASSSSAKAYTQ